MTSKSIALTGSDITVAILGIVAALLVWAVLTGRPVPLIANERGALLALGILGITMCSIGGIGKTVGDLGWAHPITILGALLGMLALGLVALQLIGVKLPLIDNDRAAITALTIIIVVKVIVSGVERFIA